MTDSVHLNGKLIGINKAAGGGKRGVLGKRTGQRFH